VIRPSPRAKEQEKKNIYIRAFGPATRKGKKERKRKRN